MPRDTVVVPILDHDVYEDLPDFINDARHDRAVQDILRDPDGSVRVHKHGRFEVIGHLPDHDSLRFVCKCAAQPEVNRFFDVDNQTLAATLPDTERLEAIHDAACPDGHFWAMRIPGRIMSLADMLALGSVTKDGYQFLVDAAGKKSIMFSGMPGTGKTTALRAVLIEPIPQSKRQIIIESDPECPKPRNGARIIANDKCGFSRLLERSLRLLPEILVVSEVIEPEHAVALARATRACIGMSSIHARSALLAPAQIMEVAKKAGGIPARDTALACQVVVQMDMDGKGGRKMTEIVTIGIENGEFVVEERII